MHSRLVCGESTAFGLLATRDPGSSSEEARAVPLSGGGGQLEFLKKRESKGEGRRAGNIASFPEGGMRARAFEARMKKSINEQEEEISRTRRVALELRVCAYIGFIERELTDLCGQQTANRPAVNPSLWGFTCI